MSEKRSLAYLSKRVREIVKKKTNNEKRGYICSDKALNPVWMKLAKRKTPYHLNSTDTKAAYKVRYWRWWCGWFAKNIIADYIYLKGIISATKRPLHANHFYNFSTKSITLQSKTCGQTRSLPFSKHHFLAASRRLYGDDELTTLLLCTRRGSGA